MSGYIDLHSHYVPAVDDGVKTIEESIALLRGLRSIGYARAVATPHIRSGMFPNEPEGLRAAFAKLDAQLAGDDSLPERGVGAEHFFDDVVFQRIVTGHGLPYPGGHAVLVELPPDRLPLGLPRCFAMMRRAGVTPVLAHPERYRDFFKKTDAMDALLDAGALPQLDLMSLVGKYGRKPKKAAERMLEEDVYYLACSDAHRPKDIEMVEKAIERLVALAGPELRDELLRTNPSHVLAGTARYE